MDARFDERQKLIRYEIGYQTLFVMIGLIACKVFFAHRFFQEVMVGDSLVIYLAMLFFITQAVFRGAYSGFNENEWYSIISFAALGLFGMFVNFNSITLSRMVVEGQLTMYFLGPLTTAFWLYIASILIIKKVITRR